MENSEKHFDEPRPRLDAVGFGLNAVDRLIVVDRYPRFNSKVPLRHHEVAPGGQVATAMVALARLGKRVGYIGKVGDDDLGRVQLDSLDGDGVERTHVPTVAGAETQTAYIVIDGASGERTIIWHHDPKLDFAPGELAQEAVIAGKILHLDGYSVAASIEAAKTARAAGRIVTIDIDQPYEGVEELLPLVDYLTASTEFPELLTGERDPATALGRLHERFGCRVAAMTLGAEGALAYADGAVVHVPAFKVECVDTTGAGDAFRGGFLFGLLEGRSLPDLLRYGNAVAALKCRALGARTGLPTRAELDRFLREFE